MAAATIRPDEGPEHFLVAALLDQDFLAEVPEDIDRKCTVQLSIAAVRCNDLLCADGVIFLIDEDNGAAIHGGIVMAETYQGYVSTVTFFFD